MLKNRYQEILVGMGLMSLVRGIISLRRNRSTLLIDDKRFSVDTYPGLFLSELEILSFIRLGKKYEIPELVDLRQFLTPARVDLVSNDRRLKLGQGPLSNFKEILRKYPELLNDSDLDQVYGEQEESFAKYFMSELARYESIAYESSPRPKGYQFDIQGPQWVRTVYKRFGELLNKEYQESKNLKYNALLHLLGITHEEKLKTSLGAEEIPFYFFRTFSPAYRLQDFFLATQLKRRLVLLGGDYKESTIQYWQFYEDKFENLLLASFEGVISGDRVLFFSHLPEEVPFHIQSPYAVYKKTKISPVKRSGSPFPPNNFICMTDINLLGSERPFRVMASGNEFSFYHWPYPELPGSKPEFYKDEATRAFEEDAAFLPFQRGGTEFGHVGTVTMDLRSLKNDKRGASPVLQPLSLDIVQNGRNIKGFEYWGAFKYKGLGYLALSYGVERI